MNSESAEDYNKSIYVCLYQTLFNAGIKDLYIRDYKWKFGSKFFQTAEAHGFLKQEKKIKILLRACVEVILKENMGYAHWLRVGKGANDPQKQRGDNKAWRRDIDYEYHLHYWEAERGQEFASIVVHNDMSIPE
jgi:hypothetical protein